MVTDNVTSSGMTNLLVSGRKVSDSTSAGAVHGFIESTGISN